MRTRTRLGMGMLTTRVRMTVNVLQCKLVVLYYTCCYVGSGLAMIVYAYIHCVGSSLVIIDLCHSVCVSIVRSDPNWRCVTHLISAPKQVTYPFT